MCFRLAPNLLTLDDLERLKRPPRRSKLKQKFRRPPEKFQRRQTDIITGKMQAPNVGQRTKSRHNENQCSIKSSSIQAYRPLGAQLLVTSLQGCPVMVATGTVPSERVDRRPKEQTDGQTDRQTDRQMTCNLNTALCSSALRGKNTETHRKNSDYYNHT